jgi:large subunit ribosomal protein L24
MNKPRIKKDDKVKVIAGKDKGKIGKIIRMYTKKERVLVENVNYIKKHQKPNAQNRQGGIIEREAPIHWSDVMLLCNKCMQPTRVEMRILEDGKKVRACKKCDELIDTK